MAAEICLSQLPSLIEDPNAEFLVCSLGFVLVWISYSGLARYDEYCLNINWLWRMMLLLTIIILFSFGSLSCICLFCFSLVHFSLNNWQLLRYGLTMDLNIRNRQSNCPLSFRCGTCLAPFGAILWSTFLFHGVIIF